jgi:hypothetical protein
MEPEVDSYSRCVSFLDHRRAVVFSSTLSQDVISPHFSAKESNHHGRPALCVMRHLMSSPDLASTHQYRMFITWWPWRSLSSWCITGQHKLGCWGCKAGWHCVCSETDYMKIFLHVKQLHISIWNALLTGQVVHGAYQQLAKHKTKCPADWG